MQRTDKALLFLIAIVLALALMTLFWSPFNKAIDREEIKLGLDLKGGTQLVYQADITQLPPGVDSGEAISNVISVLERRIDAYGVSEPVIRKVGKDRILVQLPGISNIEEARKLIGETALIKFKEQAPDDTGAITWKPATGKITVKNEAGEEVEVEKELTSQYFKDVNLDLTGTTNQPLVAFQWNDEGAKLFEQITGRLVGKPLGIFLGEDLVSSPTVKSVIKESGIIEGMSLGEARRLIKLLNAGRIDVPLRTIEEHDVSATLGSDFVDKGRKAGIVGTLVIVLFMILYYRMPGAMAGLALLIYAVMVLATFKAIGVTLTIAGIAGFILSIGMAVDANVLIFERMREEMRKGRSVMASVEVGFSRAWPAIRDSNFTTLITCGVLYWMGSTLSVPAVQGFGLTLAIGVILSMFSALVITRTILRFAGGSQSMRKPSLFLPMSQVEIASKEDR